MGCKKKIYDRRKHTYQILKTSKEYTKAQHQPYSPLPSEMWTILSMSGSGQLTCRSLDNKAGVRCCFSPDLYIHPRSRSLDGVSSTDSSENFNICSKTTVWDQGNSLTHIVATVCDRALYIKFSLNKKRVVPFFFPMLWWFSNLKSRMQWCGTTLAPNPTTSARYCNQHVKSVN